MVSVSFLALTHCNTSSLQDQSQALGMLVRSLEILALSARVQRGMKIGTGLLGCIKEALCVLTSICLPNIVHLVSA